jgi:VanZ family protein
MSSVGPRPEAGVLPLAHARAWIAASVLLLAVIVYLSLAPSVGLDLPLPRNADKLEHALAYVGLAMWFTGIVARQQFWKVALGLFALGLSIEFLQAAMHYGRQGDPWDLLANVVGIATGMAIGARRTGGWALGVEAWLGRS